MRISPVSPDTRVDTNVRANPLEPLQKIDIEALRQGLQGAPKFAVAPGPDFDPAPANAAPPNVAPTQKVTEATPKDATRVEPVNTAEGVERDTALANDNAQRQAKWEADNTASTARATAGLREQFRLVDEGLLTFDENTGIFTPATPTTAPKSAAPAEKAEAAPEPDLPATLTNTASTASVAETEPEPELPPKPEPQPVTPPATGHPLFVRPPGHDGLTHAGRQAKDAVSAKPKRPIYPAQQEQMKDSLNRGGSRRVGGAAQQEISGNAEVRIEELSMSAPVLVEMWREVTSPLRVLVARNLPTVNQELMVEDYGFAIDVMMRLFNDPDNLVLGLCEKTVNDEATTHLRTIRAHLLPGTWVNPAIIKMFNADFDGDRLKVSFDPAAMVGAKNAIDYLIGTEGDLKIDPDYWSIHPWAGDVAGQLKVMLAEFDLTRQQLNGLASAIEQTWKEDGAEAGLKSTVRWARAIGMNEGLGRPEAFVVGEILQRIYDTNAEILEATLIVNGVIDEFGVIPQYTEGMDTVEYPRIKIAETLTEPFANKKDMESALNIPFGWVPSRNLPFRVTSGWGKMARLSRLISGQDKFDNRKLMLAAYAIQMSGMYDFDEKSRAISELARKKVLEDVGYPDTRSNRHFVAWLHRFVAAYNTAAFIINCATVNVRLDKTLAPSERYHMPAIPTESGREKNNATRTAFKGVFGNIRMDVLFEHNFRPGYRNFTLDEYVYRNKEGLGFLGSGSDKIETIDGFIGRLADMRTSFAEKVNEELHGKDGKPGALALQLIEIDGVTTTKLARVFAALQENIEKKSGPTQLVREMEMLVEAFHFLGPEIFFYLQLDNPAAFEVTPLGRRFLAATSEDELLGALYEAIAVYRFAGVKELRDLYDEAEAAGDIDAMNDYHAKFEAELDEIASSSDTWDVIIRAYRNGRRHGGDDAHTGEDILDYVFFSGRGGAAIEAILNTMVMQDPMGRPDQKLIEVAADLYSNPKGMYAKNRFMSDFGHGQLLSDLRSVSPRMDAYGEVNWNHCVDQVAFAEEKHGDGIIQFLANVAADPHLLVEFRAWMMTDAILTVLDPTYASTEKGQQETAAKYLYTAVCYLMNAGVWSHMAFGGDFAVGKVSLERFWRSPGLLARLLSDPTYKLTVYSEAGEQTLTKAKILGSNDPEPAVIWQWLKDNPRAAMALRMTGQNNGVGKKGNAYTTATESLSQTMFKVLESSTKRTRANDVAVQLVAANPGFYALAVLTVGLEGQRRFQLRDQTSANIIHLTKFLRGFSRNGLPTAKAVNATVDRLFLDSFGPEHVAAIDKAYQDGMDQPKSVNETVDDLHDDEDFQLGQLREAMKVDILKYATKMAKDKRVPGLNRFSAEATARLFKLKDRSTLAAYANVVETIGSVKTEQDTAVNGAESRNLAPLMFLALATPDDCGSTTYRAEVPYAEMSKRWTEFVGLQTDNGDGTWTPLNETNWHEIAADAARRDGIVRIEDPSMCLSTTCPCKKHAVADQSTNYGGPHTPAFVKLLTIVRTLSAEMLNLKVKTQGNDGSDSIVKNDLFENALYTHDGKTIEDDINATYQDVLEATGDKALAMASARKQLAAHLSRVYHSMRYEEQISMDDYVNVAHIMIRENGRTAADGTGELRILAIGQLNLLVRSALESVRATDPDASHADYIEAATSSLLNLEAMGDGLDQDTIFSGFKVYRESRLRPELISQRESSMTRNMELVAQIVDDTGIKPVGDVELDRFEQGYYLPNAARNAEDDGSDGGSWVNGLAQQFPAYFKRWSKYAGRTRRDWKPGSELRDTYRVIGVFGAGAESNYKLSVGPRNAFIVDAKSNEAVDAIELAYRHGVNILLEGDLTDKQWKAVKKKTGLDVYQATALREGASVVGTLIPTFDLRLNGFNTALHEGASNAGSFWRDPRGALLFYVESVINEAQAGNADFVRTRMTDEIKHSKRDVYRIKANLAFGNLVAAAESDDVAVDTTGDIPQGQGDARLVIFGGRDFSDYAMLDKAIKRTALYKGGLIKEIVSGEAPGADKLGERWAREHNVPIKSFPAAWDNLEAPRWDTPNKKPRIGTRNGKPYNLEAGANRNHEMLLYASDGIGFWDDQSTGTKNMMYQFLDARKAGSDQNVRIIHTATGQMDLNGEVVDNLGNVESREVTERGIPTCEVANARELDHYILNPFYRGALNEIPIDLGIPYVGKVEHARLEEDLIAFMARVDRGELGDNGLLPTARPGEIIGFMKAQVGDEIRFHPLRPFESDNAGGAPVNMTILGAGFNRETGDIEIGWAHEGTMLDRFFKIFEDGNASAKFMARAEAIADLVMEDNTRLIGYIARASTETRRLLLRRQQKMLTLIYKARTDPWGYNLAEVDGMLAGPDNARLNEAVKVGGKKTSIGLWAKALKAGPIHFTADTDLNDLLNYMATRCVRYGIDPTILFASKHGDVPNFMWFNYQLVLRGNRTYQSSLMRLMHLMNPALCPDGLDDMSGAKTFFDRNLQVKRPVLDREGNVVGHELVDMFGGWHFLDDHYYGRSGSGAKVSTYAIPSLPALMAGGKKLGDLLLKEVLDWANIGRDEF